LPLSSTPFPYTTLFRSSIAADARVFANAREQCGSILLGRLERVGKEFARWQNHTGFLQSFAPKHIYDPRHPARNPGPRFFRSQRSEERRVGKVSEYADR